MGFTVWVAPVGLRRFRRFYGVGCAGWFALFPWVLRCGLRHFRGFYGVGCVGWVTPFSCVLRCGLHRFPWNGELEHDGWRGEIVGFMVWSCEMEAGRARMAHDQRKVTKPRVAVSKLQPVVVQDCSGDVEKWELW